MPLDTILPGIRHGARKVFGLGEDAVESIGDFLSDPTGQKGASRNVLDFYREQAGLDRADREEWLGGFDQFEGDPMQYSNLMFDINDGRFMAPGSEQYDYYNATPYSREGGPAPQYKPSYDPARTGYQGYQGGDMTGYDPYQRDEMTQFDSWDPSKISEDAGYQHQLGEGIKAVEQRASAQGRSLAPSADKEIMDYAQGLASTYGDKYYGRHMGDWQARTGQERYEDQADWRTQQGNWANLSDAERWGETFDRGTHMGDWANLSDAERWDAQFNLGRKMGEHGLMRGDYESDRNFGMDEWTGLNTLGYNMLAGDRDFQRGADIQNVGMDWQQQMYGPEFQFQMQQAQNPNAFMQTQGANRSGMAQGIAGQHRPAMWDFLNLGVNAAEAVSKFIPIGG